MQKAHQTTAGCNEIDDIHQSRVRGGHSCGCRLSQGHGAVHDCPRCKRLWGHPDITLKSTPHAGPKVRRFKTGPQILQPLR